MVLATNFSLLTSQYSGMFLVQSAWKASGVDENQAWFPASYLS